MDDDIQAWPLTEEAKTAEGLLKPRVREACTCNAPAGEFHRTECPRFVEGLKPMEKVALREAEKEPWLNQIVTVVDFHGHKYVPLPDAEIACRGVHVLTERCAKRQEIISELQAEIMDKDAEIANLREQVKNGDELNAAQSEKIRFWTQSHGELEASLDRAQLDLHETREKGLKIEGERIALEMVNGVLLDRIVELARKGG
jgi:hypothetical protein